MSENTRGRKAIDDEKVYEAWDAYKAKLGLDAEISVGTRVSLLTRENGRTKAVFECSKSSFLECLKFWEAMLPLIPTHNSHGGEYVEPGADVASIDMAS